MSYLEYPVKKKDDLPRVDVHPRSQGWWRKIRVTIEFRRRDFWVGAYWSLDRRLYFQVLPCFGIVVQFH